LLIAISASGAALAQKGGGILRIHLWDSPPSMSMLDGVNPLAQRTTMAVFNNLVMFDQHVTQSSLQSIVPDLATGWSWSEEGTALTFPLRQRRQMARRQAVHGQGCPVHLGPVARKVKRQVPRQCTQTLVQKPRAGHNEGRLRGNLSSEAAAAGISDASR
jgi:hypothetical protein